MTALQELTARLERLAPDERERRARDMLGRLERELELHATLAEAHGQIERGEGVPLEELDIVGSFRKRHGL